MKQQNWSIDAIQKTWQLVSKLHDGQKYGGAAEGEQVEYINHIGSVVFEIIHAIPHSESMDAELAIQCAMLHDTLEDTPFTFEEVNALFGRTVADGVMALTKKESSEDRLEQMRDSLERIRQQPKEIWAVKLADRITNLYAPPYYWTDDKKLSYIKEAEMIYTELKSGNAYLAERLRLKIQEYRGFLSKEMI